MQLGPEAFRERRRGQNTDLLPGSCSPVPPVRSKTSRCNHLHYDIWLCAPVNCQPAPMFQAICVSKMEMAGHFVWAFSSVSLVLLYFWLSLKVQGCLVRRRVSFVWSYAKAFLFHIFSKLTIFVLLHWWNYSFISTCCWLGPTGATQPQYYKRCFMNSNNLAPAELNNFQD